MYLSVSMPMGAVIMATVKLEGIQEIDKMFMRMSNIPFNILSDALGEMAKSAADAVEKTGSAMGVRDPESDEHILDKITTTKPKKTSGGGTADVTFSGTRERGRNNYETRNAEIAFVNEYGKRGQEKRPFIRQATEQYSKQIFDPGEKILGDWFVKQADTTTN